MKNGPSGPFASRHQHAVAKSELTQLVLRTQRLFPVGKRPDLHPSLKLGRNPRLLQLSLQLLGVVGITENAQLKYISSRLLRRL